MSQKENNWVNTDQAWHKVYARLEQDGLVHENAKPKRLPGLSVVRWAAAAAAVLVICGIFFYRTGSEGAGDSPDLLMLHNEKGSVTLVTTLEDGSIVYLADNSRLQYPERFSSEKREVILEGNALFDVTGNKECPFLIEAGQIQVEVIGTAFRVQSTGQTPFELSVQRGEVKVSDRKTGETCLVRAGQTATLQAGQLDVISSTGAGFHTFTDRIRFKDEPLENILHVINRESPDMILRASPSLSNRKLTVTFADNAPEVIAELVCAYLHATYKKEGNTLMISEPE